MTGVGLVARERMRQQASSGEGWTAAHDDEHDQGELVAAAIAYATVAERAAFVADDDLGYWRSPPEMWPWDTSQWKPSKNQVRNLVKAGALIVAEIDRLIRAGAEFDEAHRLRGKSHNRPCDHFSPHSDDQYCVLCGWDEATHRARTPSDG